MFWFHVTRINAVTGRELLDFLGRHARRAGHSAARALAGVVGHRRLGQCGQYRLGIDRQLVFGFALQPGCQLRGQTYRGGHFRLESVKLQAFGLRLGCLTFGKFFLIQLFKLALFLGGLACSAFGVLLGLLFGLPVGGVFAA